MQEREFSFEVDCGREEAWAVLHPRLRPDPSGARRVLEHGDVRIEILSVGDEHGKGLVRACTFRMPRYLLSGGRGRSWECVTELDPVAFTSRYEAVGRPPWSFATGWHRLDDLGGGRTRVGFGESYQVVSRVLRPLLEARLHDFITGDNEAVMRGAIQSGVAARRARHAAKAARAADPSPS